MFHKNINITKSLYTIGKGTIFVCPDLLITDVSINDTLVYENEGYIIKGVESFSTLISTPFPKKGIGLIVGKLEIGDILFVNEMMKNQISNLRRKLNYKKKLL